MTRKKLIQPGETISLKLTQAQRSLLLEALLLIPKEVEQAIRSTPVHEPLMFTLDELDDLAGHVAAIANHADDKSLGDKLDRISRKIEKLLGLFTDQAPPVEEPPSWFALDLFDLLSGHDPVRIPRPTMAKKGGESYPIKLTGKEREAMIASTRLRWGLKNKVGEVAEGTHLVEFTRKELDEVANELEIAIGFAPEPYKKRLVSVVAKIREFVEGLD